MLPQRFFQRALVCFAFLFFAQLDVPAQTTPPEGLRKNTPTIHAFIIARIVKAPGNVVQNGTLVIRAGLIEGVGSVAVPPDARVWDMKGMTIYPGLIDAYSDYGLPKPPSPPQPDVEGQQPVLQR